MTTKKTNQLVHIPILPMLDNVLSKYGNTSPKLSVQKMNTYLKDIGQLAGFTDRIIVNDASGGIRKEKMMFFWELLTTHVARRSFVTNFYKSLPKEIDKIRGITGHTTESQMRGYIVNDDLEAALSFSKAFAELQNQ